MPFSLLYYLNHTSKQLPKRKQKKFEGNIHKIDYDEDQLNTLNSIHPSLRKHVMVLQQNNNFKKRLFQTQTKREFQKKVLL